MKYKTKIGKDSKGLYIIIPKEVVEVAKLKDSQDVEIFIKSNKLFLVKVIK